MEGDEAGDPDVQDICDPCADGTHCAGMTDWCWCWCVWPDAREEEQGDPLSD